MKLAALYSVFNGLELLEGSIRQIAGQCSHIVICYQTVSNLGEVDNTVESKVQEIADSISKCWPYVDVSLIRYETNVTLHTKQNERHKHNIMLAEAKNLGCTHFFMSACDHYYMPDEFLIAKDKVEAGNYDVTYTHMFTYYKHPTWQLTPIEDYYMPFICKLKPETLFVTGKKSLLRVDPSLILNTDHNQHLFRESEIMLHHYSMIRVDIESKFRNAASSVRWKPEQVQQFKQEWSNYDLETNPGVSYFQGRKIKIIPDYFSFSAD